MVLLVHSFKYKRYRCRCNKFFYRYISTVRNENRVFCSKKCASKSQKQSLLGENNPNWKGGISKYVPHPRILSNTYSALHRWLKRRIPKPSLCRKCHKNKPYDLANISQEYKRDLSDWKWICRGCHMDSDGRLKNLELGRINGKRDIYGKYTTGTFL